VALRRSLRETYIHARYGCDTSHGTAKRGASLPQIRYLRPSSAFSDTTVRLPLQQACRQQIHMCQGSSWQSTHFLASSRSRSFGATQSVMLCTSAEYSPWSSHSSHTHQLVCQGQLGNKSLNYACHSPLATVYGYNNSGQDMIESPAARLQD
jgi:hypothetical protein